MIYLVARAGNEREGLRGDDTFFIIRAESAEQAVARAESELIHFPAHPDIPKSCYSVHEIHDIGRPDGDVDYLILGPLYGLNIFLGEGKSLFSDTSEESWME
jgi:hypothetical protein